MNKIMGYDMQKQNLMKINSINSSLEKEVGRIDLLNHSFSLSFDILLLKGVICLF